MSKVRLLGHSLWYIFAVCMIVLAVAFTVGRLILARADQYKADIERQVSEQLGARAEIGTMRASLRGYRPEIRLKNIRLQSLDPSVAPLEIRELRVGLNLSELIFSGLFRPAYLSIVGTKLIIERAADGHLSVVGLSAKASEPSQSSGQNLAWLITEGEFEVLNSEITWVDRTRDVPPLVLTQTHVRIENSFDRHRVGLMANLPAEMGETLRAQLDIEGDLTQAAGWGGQVYLEANQVTLPALFARLPFKQIQVESGISSVRLWSEWAAARPIFAQGEVKLTEAQVQLEQSDAPLPIEYLHSDFDWAAQADGWQMHLARFSLRTGSLSQEGNRVSMRYVRVGDAKPQIIARADQLDLQLWSQLVLQTGLLGAKLSEPMASMQPHGKIDALTLAYDGQPEHAAWSLCGTFKDLGLAAWKRLPHLERISGEACVADSSGWAEFQSSQAEFELPWLFRSAFNLDHAEGRLDWWSEDDAWWVHSGPLKAENADVKSVSQLDMHIPRTDGKPYLVLETRFADGIAKEVAKYLPAGILKPKPLAWLDGAFLGGRVPTGLFRFRGDAGHFPFRDHPGEFLVRFEVEDGVLDFAPDWPNLSQLAGTVTFKNEGLYIQGRKGVISGTALADAEVSIPDLKYSDYVEIKGQVSDDASGLYRFLRASPLAESVQALLDQSEISGPAKVDLDLKVPLHHGFKPAIQVNAQVNQARMHFPNWNIDLSGITGEIQYDAYGLQARSISGQVLGQPVSAQIKSDAKQTLITAEATIPMKELARTYPSDAWRHVSGQSPVAMRINVPHNSRSQKDVSELTLNSTLQGVAIEAPAPLGKSAPDSVPLSWTIPLSQSADNALRIQYGKRMQAKLRFADDKRKLVLDRADFHLGGGEATLPPRAGVRLSGALQELDVAAWQDWHKPKAASDQGKAASLVNQIDLKAARLLWSNRVLEDVGIRVVHDNQAWAGAVEGPILQGQVQIPDVVDATHPIELSLDHLALPDAWFSDADDKAVPVEKQGTNPINPKALPSIALQSKRFLYNGNDLGALEVRATQVQDGLKFDALKVKSKRDDLQASGNWLQPGGKARTRLQGNLNSESFGDLLSDLGFTSQLKETEATIEFDLNWDEAPHHYSNALLNGHLNLRTEKGRLLDLEPGVGRVFGLLSLGTIQRRLQLDFSDLLQKGMSFDKIRGTYQIVDGQAETSNFYLDGPAARLDIQGRIGLADRDYDQFVTVTPKTTSSLPVAGAIAGGPVVGAAVFLAQKLIGKQVESITRLQYHVTGSWDDPQIQQIRSPSKSVLDKIADGVTPDGIGTPKP